MKLFNIISLLLIFVFAAACSTTELAESDPTDFENSSQRSDTVSDINDYYRSLADFLRRTPGINISGGENNTVVTIRGVNSFYSEVQPLYVIDGQTVGTDYNQVNRMINPRDIDYVRVLKGSDASIYGVRGGNGVILIVTK